MTSEIKVSLDLRGTPVEVTCSIGPAEPAVGLTQPYVEEVIEITQVGDPLPWVLSTEEMELVCEKVYQKMGFQAEMGDEDEEEAW